MRKYWFRLITLAVAFVALATYLFANTPWRSWVGLQPDYRNIIGPGDRIVVAVEQFRSECGLWPQYLEELMPGYLEKLPEATGSNRQWFYDISPVTREDGITQVLPTLSIHVREQ